MTESDPPSDGGPSSSWEREPSRPYWAAVKATAVISAIFVLALALAGCLRLWALSQAADSITNLAVEIQQAPEGKKRSEALETLAEVNDNQAGSGPPIRRRLVTSLDAELRQQGFGKEPTRAVIQKKVRSILWQGSLPANLLLHALLVLYFPALFGVMYFQAAQGLSKMRAWVHGGKAGPLNLEEHVRLQRHHRWLTDEARALVWRRFSFALLIAMGTNYILSPAGIQASIVGEYAAIRPPAGVSSHPFGFEYFGHAPPYVVGLAGYYLYVSTTLASRFMAGNLSNRSLPSLINRLVTVIVLGLVLSGITEGEGLTRAIVFIAAVFPETGLRYIAKVAQASSSSLSLDASSGFRSLPEIDSNKQAALAEVGVSSGADLASARLRHLIETVGIHPRLLIRACDRSMLFYVIGVERAEKLAAISVYTASDLVLFARGRAAYLERWERAGRKPPHDFADALDAEQQQARLAAVNHALEVDDASLLVAQLASSANVRFAMDIKVTYGGP